MLDSRFCSLQVPVFVAVPAELVSLAVFFAWLIAAALLDALTVLPRWVCLLLPAVIALVLMYKRPEWF